MSELEKERPVVVMKQVGKPREDLIEQVVRDARSRSAK